MNAGTTLHCIAENTSDFLSTFIWSNILYFSPKPSLTRLAFLCCTKQSSHLGRLHNPLLSFSESRQAQVREGLVQPDILLGQLHFEISSISGVARLLHVGSTFVHVAVAPYRSFLLLGSIQSYLCRSPWASPVHSMCWLAHAAFFTQQWDTSYLETPRPTLSSRQPSKTARPQRRGQVSPSTLCAQCQTDR